MSEAGKDQSQVAQSDVPLNAVAIGNLVRDEIERNNKYFEFAQGQIEKDRSFYKHLYSYAVGFLAFMVLVAGYFQYASVSQMRSDMRTSVDAEIQRDKAEMDALRAQALETSAEARSTVSQELANVRTEVQKRIDTEFQSDNITNLVATAAKERTEKELSGIIRSETSTQVAKGIQDEGPVIKKTVEDQTKEAVKALEPTIKASVEKATQDQVRLSVAPIQSQIATYADYIRIGNLATLARSDNRQAFDYLVQVAFGKKPESSNIELRQIADSTAGAIIVETESGLHLSRTFREKQSTDAMKKIMQSTVRIDREAALDNYPQDDKSILPTLIQMIKTDGSISVVYKATARFNLLTKQSFEFWKTDEILQWWEKNGAQFQ